MVKKVLFLMTMSVGMMFPSMAQNIPSYVPTNGLVGWWPFNGNANDESGNGNHGTVNGATLTTDRDGKPNSAYSFDGVDDVITSLLNNNSKVISVSIWINVNKDNFSYPLGLGYNSVSGHGYGQGFSSSTPPCELSNKTFFIFDGYETCQHRLESKSVNEINKWENIIFIIENNSIKMYHNNILSGKLDNFIFRGINSLKFGKRSDNIFPFGGKIDDIAIYNRALSDQEVKQLYQGCSSETATSTSFNSVLLTTGNTLALSAVPQGGVFKAASVLNNQFVPSKAKIGLNKVQYSFKNSQGCNDSTLFSMIVADTVGNTCKKYDTILKLKFKLTTGINANQMTSMTLYPNPTTDVLNIEIGDAKALDGYRYRILDAVGKEVYNQLVKNPRTEIPLKSLGAAGMYLFEVIDQQNKTIQSNKIVLE